MRLSFFFFPESWSVWNFGNHSKQTHWFSNEFFSNRKGLLFVATAFSCYVLLLEEPTLKHFKTKIHWTTYEWDETFFGITVVFFFENINQNIACFCFHHLETGKLLWLILETYILIISTSNWLINHAKQFINRPLKTRWSILVVHLAKYINLRIQFKT